MTQLSVRYTLRQIKDTSIVELAIELCFNEDKIEKILQQWTNINFVKWDVIPNDDTIKFWAQVSKYKNAAGINAYQNLADLAIAVLSLPHSNTEVERTFSIMNIVKSKLRNRLATTTLNSIMLIRNQLKCLKETCKSYVLPSEVLSQMTKTVKNIN